MSHFSRSLILVVDSSTLKTPKVQMSTVPKVQIPHFNPPTNIPHFGFNKEDKVKVKKVDTKGIVPIEPKVEKTIVEDIVVLETESTIELEIEPAVVESTITKPITNKP